MRVLHMAAVPTWEERGIKGPTTNFRAVIAPGGTEAGAVRLRENRYARLAALEEWKTALGRNLRVENFLDAAKTSVAVAGYATEVEMLVGTLGLRKSP
jgi:tripartite-type tricarboxylate transporter receptor subunit TctC